MEGDKYMNSFVIYFGGIFDVFIVLGGKCFCDYCEDVLVKEVKGNMLFIVFKVQNEFG